MKKILLLVLLMCLVASGAKYTFVGDSRLALDTAVCNEFIRTLNDGSTFVNRSVSGYGWDDFDLLFGRPHQIEYFINTDTPDYVVLQLGVNNTWDSLAVGFAGAYCNDLKEYRYLNKFVNIVKGAGKIPIIVEMQSAFSTHYDSDSIHLENQLERIIRRNAMRKEYCASHNILYVATFDTFALANKKPNPTYYNSDRIHFNRTGNLLFGQLLASPIVPTSTKVYTEKRLQLDGMYSYSTTKKKLYTLDLKKITDSLFWYNVKPNGNNLVLKVNDTKVNRNLREFDSYSRLGIVRFQYQDQITKIELSASATIEPNGNVFDSCNILRLYPFDEPKSSPTTIYDIANNNDAFVATDRAHTYYTANSSIPDSLRMFKYCYFNSSRSLISDPTGMSGLNKFTIDFWVYLYNDNWWTMQNSILTSIGNSTSATFRIACASAFNISIGSTSTRWGLTLDNAKIAISDSAWHKVSLSFDLTQSVQSNKVVMVVDTNVITTGTITGTLPNSLPTFTAGDSLNIIGWYATGFWPNGAAFRDFKIYNDAVTSIEAIADYKLQTGQFTVTPLTTTFGVDTLILTCTATGYDSLRWFHNGIATDSTGLTYTILADSAFYASEHGYYVMAYNVSGSAKSGEWWFGAPIPVFVTDTITLTCTATGYDSLRWFHNNLATDSIGLTYTILADSAWYASKQVYYVMAYNDGGSTKSGEWRFGGSGSNQNPASRNRTFWRSR